MEKKRRSMKIVFEKRYSGSIFTGGYENNCRNMWRTVQVFGQLCTSASSSCPTKGRRVNFLSSPPLRCSYVTSGSDVYQFRSFPPDRRLLSLEILFSSPDIQASAFLFSNESLYLPLCARKKFASSNFTSIPYLSNRIYEFWKSCTRLK